MLKLLMEWIGISTSWQCGSHPFGPRTRQANKLVSFPAFEHFHVSGVLCPVSRVSCLLSWARYCRDPDQFAWCVEHKSTCYVVTHLLSIVSSCGPMCRCSTCQHHVSGVTCPCPRAGLRCTRVINNALDSRHVTSPGQPLWDAVRWCNLCHSQSVFISSI